MSKKALLMILDGWGMGNHSKADIIYNTPTPYWDSLLANYPNSQLLASGEDVGLPDGQMGQLRSRSPEHWCRTSGLSGFGENKYRLPRQQHLAKP